MHFSTGRQIFYIGDLIFYGDYTGTKAFVTAADLIEGDGNLHCFMPPLSSCEIKISVVSQCRILVAVQYMNTQEFAFCCSTDNLHLLDCSVSWSLLTQTDADWTCWLIADARVTGREHKHKFETDPDSSHTVHRYTANKRYTAGCCWCVNHGRTATSSVAISWRDHEQEMLPTISRNCPIRTALTFQCRHQRLCSSQTQNYQWMHIPLEYALKTVRKICSVLHNLKWNNYVMTICVIIPGLPKRNQE